MAKLMSDEETTRWHPMTEHVFPWPHENLVVVAFAKDEPEVIDLFRVRVGEHGALFNYQAMLSLHEQGWVPFAWRVDDTPDRDDERLPPLWTDYLTRAPQSP